MKNEVDGAMLFGPEEPEMGADEKWRRYRKQARMMAMMVDVAFAEENFVCAGGRCVCEHCGLEYLDHPAVFDEVLHLLCDGTFVKL